jgi:hypothetical protein
MVELPRYDLFNMHIGTHTVLSLRHKKIPQSNAKKSQSCAKKNKLITDSHPRLANRQVGSHSNQTQLKNLFFINQAGFPDKFFYFRFKQLNCAK